MTLEASALVERDGSDISVETPPLELVVGMNHPSLGSKPFPEYNGFRIKKPGDPRIWLVDRGQKRHIPNPTTFNNLFRNWSYREVLDVDAIQTGSPISDGAVLGRATGEPAVFLIDQGIKRHIVSPATMDKYNFNWNRVYTLPRLVIDSMPTGDPIS